jgi:hypothetical protein
MVLVSLVPSPQTGPSVTNRYMSFVSFVLSNSFFTLTDRDRERDPRGHQGGKEDDDKEEKVGRRGLTERETERQRDRETEEQE